MPVQRLILLSFIIFSVFFAGCTFDVSGPSGQNTSNNIPDASDDITDSGDIADISDVSDVSDISDIEDASDVSDSGSDDILDSGDDVIDSGVECEADDSTCLDDFTLQFCNSSGEFDTSVCEFGCDHTLTPNGCLDFIPSNGLDKTILSTSGLLPFEISATAVFNSSTGEITVDGVQLRAPGEGMDLENGIIYSQHAMSDGRAAGVFAFTSFTVQPTGIVRVIGDIPVIFLAESIYIRGILDVSANIQNCEAANRRCPGPGGFGGGSTNSDGQGPGAGKKGIEDWWDEDETGGGGAGFNCEGASGGGGTGGAAGSIYGNEMNEPLVGGSGGGGGGHYELGNENNGQGLGGGGAGAVQLTALSVVSVGNSVGTPCGIKASGAGGGGNDSYANSGGGGGGSGGAVIIEAPHIQLFPGSTLAANGGGGGAGKDGADGNYGHFDATPADGAQCSDCNTGGNGASLNASVPASGSDADGNDGTGGGGAGTGRITIRDCISFINSGIISPSPHLGGCHR
ncbi:MAG: hypothetical protein JXR95_02465 [Deltaproteobacteria bacterium]|nr:hypothetical protein [Deltaproteobacteria bacterium]